MPLINVKLIEGVFDAEEKEAIIEKVTEAMVSVDGESMRTVTWVTVEEEVASGSWASPARRCTPATSSACGPLRSSDVPSGTNGTVAPSSSDASLCQDPGRVVAGAAPAPTSAARRIAVTDRHPGGGRRRS